ncbi:MAG: hypothetical protein H7A23_18925 [Leptospiraceae bacterium]|nr:hypothetical protein [Leptospiraceae bacterium]MCP5496627.1 hypothetical protein [Leptospiraceae bacterium]
MNREKLFGLKTDGFSNFYLGLLKQFITSRYNIKASDIPLTSKEWDLIPQVRLVGNGETKENIEGLVIGTIRMGYGHHRMAASLYTWAIHKGLKPYLHDLLAIESNEAKAIKGIEGVYNFFSKMASEYGGVIEWFWGQMTSKGNIQSLALSTLLAEDYKSLFSVISTNCNYISSYPLNGQIAVASGLKKVVNLVMDNFPQYYLLVPGALNVVQSESSYIKFLSMGIPEKNLAVAGHWVPYDLAAFAIEDSNHRIQRIKQKKKKRLVLPIGGAGAQKSYILELIEKLKDNLTKKENCLLQLNAGDHEAIFQSILVKLKQLKIEYDLVTSWQQLIEYCHKQDLSKDTEAKTKPVVVFYFQNYYEAFLATDKLIKVSDFLVTKPSELAFFPIPKVFIRRVGDHEGYSVSHSLELGEGTVECREPSQATEIINLLLDNEDISSRMNECVIRNSKEGVYNGSEKAIDYCLGLE